MRISVGRGKLLLDGAGWGGAALRGGPNRSRSNKLLLRHADAEHQGISGKDAATQATQAITPP